MAISWLCWNSAQSILTTRPRVADQGFGERLYGAGLAGAGGAEEQEAADGAARGRETGVEGLVDPDDLADGVVLADDAPAQAVLQRLAASPIRSGSRICLRPVISVPS